MDLWVSIRKNLPLWGPRVSYSVVATQPYLHYSQLITTLLLKVVQHINNCHPFLLFACQLFGPIANGARELENFLTFLVVQTARLFSGAEKSEAGDSNAILLWEATSRFSSSQACALWVEDSRLQPKDSVPRRTPLRKTLNFCKSKCDFSWMVSAFELHNWQYQLKIWI